MSICKERPCVVPLRHLDSGTCDLYPLLYVLGFKATQLQRSAEVLLLQLQAAAAQGPSPEHWQCQRTTCRLYHLALTFKRALSPGGSSTLRMKALKSSFLSKSNNLQQKKHDDWLNLRPVELRLQLKAAAAMREFNPTYTGCQSNSQKAKRRSHHRPEGFHFFFFACHK